MNVTFHLPTPALDARFVSHSMTADLHGLQGHTGLGGIRASLYNAVPLEAVHALVAFMHDFQQRYG
jgi:phosphoserine aminotransferase